MRNIIIFCFGCIFLLSCKQDKKEVIRKTESTVKIEKVEIDTFLNTTLKNVLEEYSNIYTLNNREKPPTRQSYYIGFSRFGSDTILAIGRQPFLFELFPDFAFSYKSPKEPIVPVGLIYYKRNLPVIIFDEKNPLGRAFYDSNLLIKKIEDQYKIKEEFDTLIPPLWKYKVQGKQLDLLEKTDSLIIK